MTNYTGCLYTTVVNTSGVKKSFGCLPPYGGTLAAGASFTYIGSPVDWIQRQRGMSPRSVMALEKCLEKGWLTIRQTPAAILYDPTAEESYALTLDDGELIAAEPCWLYAIANQRQATLQAAVNAFQAATGAFPTSSIATQLVSGGYIAAIPALPVGAQAGTNGILIDGDGVPTVNEASAGNGWVYSPSTGLIVMNSVASSSPYVPAMLNGVASVVAVGAPQDVTHGPFNEETVFELPIVYEYQIYNLGPDDIEVDGTVLSSGEVHVAAPQGGGQTYSGVTVVVPADNTIRAVFTPVS